MATANDEKMIAGLPTQHQAALRWFSENAGGECQWPGSSPAGLLASRAKGIYKPRWSKYALSVRQAVNSPYPNLEPSPRADGTWAYSYFQEGKDPHLRDSRYTNRALVACWHDRVPIGVLKQVSGRPKARYRVLGLALVTGWKKGYFLLEGFSPSGTVNHGDGTRAQDWSRTAPKHLIANITWNRHGWRNLYVDPRAGHRYARKYPGHESLNFDFSKKGIDTADEVYGHIAWTRPPAKFGPPGFIFFYSRNLDTGGGEIVGVYGNARITDRRKVPCSGFHNNVLELNVAAQKSLSMLFPVPLRASRYSNGRLVPQCGFTYIGKTLADGILRDEIHALHTAGGPRLPELQKLKNIYSLATGKNYQDDYQDDDLQQQEEIVGHLQIQKVSRQSIAEELRRLRPTDPQTVTIRAKAYKRDNKTIAQLKILRGFKCQLCQTQIRKRNGGFYAEAAHITPKSRRGLEMPDNILILCPNHHKEFDLGDRKITSRLQEKIEFYLNGRFFKVDLRLLRQ